MTESDPRKLVTTGSLDVQAAYDPKYWPNLPPQEPQTFQFWFPWFLMSGVGQLYTKGPAIKGRLTFAPDNMIEGELPEISISITSIEEK